MIETTGEICLGLTAQSPNDAVRDAAFAFALGKGYMIFATAGEGAPGVPAPSNRGLELHALDDEGNLYVGASRGKRFCEDIERCPWVSGVVFDRLAVRIDALVVKDDRPAVRERYWRQNRGTEAMYKKALDNFQIYRFVRGEGEVFHVYADDKIRRVRFGFGGMPPRPWRYAVDPARCVGCGACAAACMTGVIRLSGGRAVQDHSGCNECGVCATACPHAAIPHAAIAAAANAKEPSP